MKQIFFFIFLFFNSIIFAQTYYKGLERMCKKNKNGKTDCYDSPRLWYHENTLLLTNDSVFIYKTPVQIKGKRKLYSASDGGFKYYFGNLVTKSKDTIAYLTMHNCDYCPTPIKIDPITDYCYPIPRKDTLKFSKNKNGITIGEVKYKKILQKEKIEFPQKQRFYFDSINIHRVNPSKQYSLISRSIEDFYKTKELKIENETLIICTEREDEFGKKLELLESSKFDVNIFGIKTIFYSKSELQNLVLKNKIVLRYILIGEIRESLINAGLDISYNILLSSEIHNFEDKEFRNSFTYKKIKDKYSLESSYIKNGWGIIQQK